MDSINDYLAKIEDILMKMDDAIEGSRAIPFANKVAVDKQDLFDQIDEIRNILDEANKGLPNEIIQAKRIIDERDKIIQEGKNKAELIIRNGEDQVVKLTDEHEISKLAAEKSTQIIEEGKKAAREMRVNAMEYTDEILAKTEETVKKAFESFNRSIRDTSETFTTTIDAIYEDRQSLRGVKK